MKLGHLIRKYRFLMSKATSHVSIAKAELLRLLDAADLGLYLNVSSPLEIHACEEQTRGVIAEREALKKERATLRGLYD